MGVRQPAPEPRRRNDATGELSYNCPLCDDTGGHMQLNPEKGVFYCYRCCEGGGIAHLSRVTNVDWPSQVEHIVEMSVVAQIFGRPELVDKPLVEVAYDYGKGGPHIFGEEAAFVGGVGYVKDLLLTYGHYSGTIPILTDVRQYLDSRGVTESERRSWGLFAVTSTAADAARRGTVLVPGWDPRTGCLLGWQTRVVYPCGLPLSAGDVGAAFSLWFGPSGPKYLGPKVKAKDFYFIYSPSVVVPQTRIVLVEGPFDAIAVERAGFPCAAMMGKRVSPAGLDQLKSIGVRELIVLLDSVDKDGRVVKSTLTLTALASSVGFDVKIATLDHGDPGVAGIGEIRDAVGRAEHFSTKSLCELFLIM